MIEVLTQKTKHVSNQISVGDAKKWERGNIVNKITAQNFTKLLKGSKPQTQEANQIQTYIKQTKEKLENTEEKKIRKIPQMGGGGGNDPLRNKKANKLIINLLANSQ